MPSFRVGGSSVSLREFDVVGADGIQPHFIVHTGLAESESDATHEAQAVAVLDMGPPLHGRGRGPTIPAHAVGRAELDFGEVQKIRTFVDQHAGEHSSFLQLSKTDILRPLAIRYSQPRQKNVGGGEVWKNS